MNKRYPLSLLLASVARVAATGQDVHINAGALSPSPGAQLDFVNGTEFATNSLYVVTLDPATNGPYAGVYYRDGLTFTALAATPDNGGPEFGHAALGATLALEVVSVAGPAGGQFGFWEAPANGIDGTNLTWSLAVGTTGGTNQFPLSENDGTAGADPYGHIHGRIYSATLPGLYNVGFRLLDISTNGPGGGPIHTPSDLFHLYFQAGLAIAAFTQPGGTNTLVFGTKSARNYFLETAPGLEVTNWTTATGPLAGNDHLQTVTAPAAGLVRFYRLRAEGP